MYHVYDYIWYMWQYMWYIWQYMTIYMIYTYHIHMHIHEWYMWYISPQKGFAELHSDSTFDTLRKLHTNFYNKCTNLQQCVRIPPPLCAHQNVFVVLLIAVSPPTDISLWLLCFSIYLFLFYVYGCVWMLMYVHCVHAWCLWKPERVLDLLELEVWKIDATCEY